MIIWDGSERRGCPLAGRKSSCIPNPMHDEATLFRRWPLLASSIMTTNTSAMARRASSCSPSRWRDGGAVDAQERRTKQDWAKQIAWLLDEQYPEAKKVVLVPDNLNVHSSAALYANFPPQKAFSLTSRLEFHFTPKHGSWLDIAEIELSALGRQCLGTRRIPDLQTLRNELKPWCTDRNDNTEKRRLAVHC